MGGNCFAPGDSVRAWRWLAAGALTGVVLGLLPTCSPSAPVCDPYTCFAGCCTIDGRCLEGTAVAACGAAGQLCKVCDSGQVCDRGLCVSGEKGPCADAPDGGTEIVTLFAKGTSVSGVRDAGNFRDVSAVVEVDGGCYSSIQLVYRVGTPCSTDAAGCDRFPRITRLTVNEPGGPRYNSIFLFDGVTLGRSDATFTTDLTDYLPALVGSREYALHVTTSAVPDGGEGSQARWDVEAWLELTRGPRHRETLAVQPVFFNTAYTSASAPLFRTLSAPPKANAARVDLYSTGHDAKGPNLCDERCKKRHVLTIDGVEHVFEPWRDCSDYGKAGWCPGEAVERRSFPFTPGASAGSNTINLSIENVEGYFSTGAAALYFRDDPG